MSSARPRLSLLAPEQIDSVHEASIRILSERGIRVDSERARRCLAKGSARVEGDRVLLGRELVDEAIATAPSTIDIHDRAGQKAFTLGGESAPTRFGVGVTNLWYQEPSTDELVPFARRHMASGVRLSEALSSYDVISTLGVLRDLPPSVADLYATLEMIANSTKPLVLLVSDEKLFPPTLELLEALRGELDTKPYAIPYLNPITPLVLNEGTSDKLLDAAERSIPTIYSNYGMAGMTTPLGCAGTLALLNAELLAGLVLAQLAKPGAPMILGSLPLVFDMKTMVDFYDPRTILVDLACAEMMAHYQIPHAGTSGSGEGFGPDLPAAGVCWMNQIASVLGRVGLAPFVGSSLNSKAFSPALTVYGDEVIRAARSLAEGFPIDEATIGVSEILEELAMEGHFLTAPQTLERYREVYREGLFPHIGLEKWVETGHTRAETLLRERTTELLETAPAPEDRDDVLARGTELLERLTAGLGSAQ